MAAATPAAAAKGGGEVLQRHASLLRDVAATNPQLEQQLAKTKEGLAKLVQHSRGLDARGAEMAAGFRRLAEGALPGAWVGAVEMRARVCLAEGA